MITKITAANADEFYNPRFQEITDALKKAGKNITINSLETYFSNLTDIAALPTKKVIGQNTDGTPVYAAGKYLVVPFDEPYFEIDANTRTIAVPDHFKKYGVGVQGDNLAEMLVFKVDRYFDHQDFLEADVAITWSFTPKGSRTPIIGTPQKGFAQDSELEPGYIVFGFIITREMAQNTLGELTSGTLTFAVSFYKEDPDEAYAYSWNTIPVSVTINEGLELKDPSLVKDVSRNIIARITNSAYTPDEIAPLIDPAWMSGATEVDPVTGQAFYLGLPKVASFHMDDDGVEDDVLVLTAQAYSDARAKMEYTWFSGLDAENVLIARAADSYATSTDFMESQDEEPVENKAYYINVQEIIGTSAREAAFEDLNNVILEVVSGEAIITADNEPKEAKTYYKHVEGTGNMVKVLDADTLNALFADGLTEYELDSSLDVTEAGSYAVRAQAVKEIYQSNVVTPAIEEDDDSFKVTVGVAPKTTLRNQGATSVYQSGDKVILTARFTELIEYNSDNPSQGSHKWLPIALHTNVDDITRLTWDGEPLTAADVAEAEQVELGAGDIIFWAKADVLKDAPRTITIGNTDTGEEVKLVVSFIGGPISQAIAEAILDDGTSSENVADGGSVIVAKSQTINSNICVVPAAAIPSVELSVETTLGANENDEFEVINEEAAEGLTFISNDSAPSVIATVSFPDSQYDGEDIGAIAFEAISGENIAELTYEEILANTKSEENPEGKYEFEVLEDGQKQVNTAGVVTEGSYVVRAINRRNHSYGVSAPSQVIRTSFVAPKINAVTVKTVEGSTEIKLLDAGQFPEGAENGMFIRLNSDYPTRRFTLVDESENLEGAVPTYYIEEVIRTENGYEKIVEYEVVNNNGALECEIDDEGLYRVRVENVYNGTRRIGYTEVFEVLRLV